VCGIGGAAAVGLSGKCRWRVAVLALALLVGNGAVDGGDLSHGASNSSSLAAAVSPPNILIIVTDDQRSGLSAMPATRRIFKRDGIRYPDAYVTDPLCCPSRASIMTGRYSHNTGVRSNIERPELGVSAGSALDASSTIQRYLDDAGYTTALFGKYLNKWDFSKAPPYFDSFALVNRQRGYYRNRVSVGTASAGVTNIFVSEMYNATIVRERTLGFLRSQAKSQQPFFLYVAPGAPHNPFTPEPKYADDTFGAWAGNPAVGEANKSDKPRYVQAASARLMDGRRIRTRQYRTLESVDRMIDAIYAELRAQRKDKNTLAFFISDNGSMWGEHGLLGKNVPYTSSVQVPFFMRWPSGPLTSGTSDPRGAANIDIAPTVLQAAGIPIPSTTDGHSLLGDWHRERRLTEHWCNITKCLFWAAERTREYHYIEYYDGPNFDTANVTFREYYDLIADPYELRNLLRDGDPANDPDVTTPAALLAADRNCAGDACP